MRYAFVGQALTAAIFLALAYMFGGRDHVPLMLDGTHIRGTIVDSQERYFAGTRDSSGHTSTGHTAYMPIVELDDLPGGETVRFKDWLGSKTLPTIGERVSVLYDPEDPSHAMIDRGFKNWLPWAPILGVGVFLAIVAFRGWLAFLREDE